MNNQQSDKQVALPAQEEIKKHGDKLQQQVDDAKGGGTRERKDHQKTQDANSPEGADR